MEKSYCEALDMMLPHVAQSETFIIEKGSIIEHFSYHLYIFCGKFIATQEYAGTSGGCNSSTWNHFEERLGWCDSVQEFYTNYVFPARKAQSERDSKEEE